MAVNIIDEIWLCLVLLSCLIISSSFFFSQASVSVLISLCGVINLGGQLKYSTAYVVEKLVQKSCMIEPMTGKKWKYVLRVCFLISRPMLISEWTYFICHDADLILLTYNWLNYICAVNFVRKSGLSVLVSSEA